MEKIVLGIDVGGTNIKLGLVNQRGKIISRSCFSTKQYFSSRTKLIDQIEDQCREMIQKYKLARKQIKGIGIGLPGLINAQKGLVYSLTNIPGWEEVPLKRILERSLCIPTFIDNDANVIALGEWKWGAGRNQRNIIAMTLGTGIGGGLIIENNLYRGEGFAAGEIGHIPIEKKGRRCNCTGHGCLETRTGNTFLLHQAKKIFRQKNISLEEVTKLADQGDPKAIFFWKEIGEILGMGLTGVVNVLNPQCIVVGGGVANAFKYICPAMAQSIQKRAMLVQGGMVKIVKSKLGADAGIIGTQVLVEEEMKRSFATQRFYKR